MALFNVEILTRQDLDQFKKELFEELRSTAVVKQHKKSEPREWLRSYEVREMLNISANTLHSLRIKGVLPFKRIGGSMYYRYQDIRQLMEEIK